MTESHTPGPWGVVERPADRSVGGRPSGTFIVAAAAEAQHEDFALARIYAMDGPDEKSTNARLIAAAPELLTAASRALAVLRATGESVRLGNVLGALQSAIDKAEGKA